MIGETNRHITSLIGSQPKLFVFVVYSLENMFEEEKHFMKIEEEIKV